jgi:hypothetical protein
MKYNEAPSIVFIGFLSPVGDDVSAVWVVEFDKITFDRMGNHVMFPNRSCRTMENDDFQMPGLRRKEI